MIFKTVENLDDDSKRDVPLPLASAVRLSDSARGAISQRLGFRRHVDEADGDEPQGADEGGTNDDEADEANRQHGVQTRAKKGTSGDGVTWTGVADLLKKIFFAFYVLFYLAFMFAFLC